MNSKDGYYMLKTCFGRDVTYTVTAACYSFLSFQLSYSQLIKVPGHSTFLHRLEDGEGKPTRSQGLGHLNSSLPSKAVCKAAH